MELEDRMRHIARCENPFSLGRRIGIRLSVVRVCASPRLRCRVVVVLRLVGTVDGLVGASDGVIWR